MFLKVRYFLFNIRKFATYPFVVLAIAFIAIQNKWWRIR